MFKKIRSDFKAVFEMDPAATSKVEVLLTYSGFHAILMHRVAHWLQRMGMPFFARVLSQFARFLTGVEIHPAAKIGGHFFIDHGMGVVIGETTEIGEHVTLFQGATLGGTGKERGKRHPTVGDHVVIGAGSKVLGGITIGDHVKVGANAVVLSSVPPHSTVVGVPGKVVRVHGRKTSDEAMLDHTHMPDPMSETIMNLQKRLQRLEQRQEGGRTAQPAGKEKPAQKKRASRKSSSKTVVIKHAEVEAMPVETVEERQARMARMEKLEKRKTMFSGKQKERPASQPEAEPGQPEAPAKKRVRRRRRSTKKPEGAREAASVGASEPGSSGAGPSEGGKPGPEGGQ